MDSSLLTQIFFTITAIAVVVVTVLLGIGLYYAILILKDVKALSTKVKDEGEKIIDDVRQFREETEDKGFYIKNMMNSFVGSAINAIVPFFGGTKHSKIKSKKDN